MAGTIVSSSIGSSAEMLNWSAWTAYNTTIVIGMLMA